MLFFVLKSHSLLETPRCTLLFENQFRHFEFNDATMAVVGFERGNSPRDRQKNETSSVVQKHLSPNNVSSVFLLMFSFFSEWLSLKQTIGTKWSGKGLSLLETKCYGMAMIKISFHWLSDYFDFLSVCSACSQQLNRSVRPLLRNFS